MENRPFDPLTLPSEHLATVTPSVQATHTLQVNLEGMPLDQLLELRNQIEQRLPAKDLKDLDLQRELVLQVLALQTLQGKVLKDDETPANQQAQVANALSAALTTLVKLQSDVFTTERLKRLEAALIEVINEQPTELQEAFLRTYSERLTSV